MRKTTLQVSSRVGDKMSDDTSDAFPDKEDPLLSHDMVSQNHDSNDEFQRDRTEMPYDWNQITIESP